MKHSTQKTLYSNTAYLGRNMRGHVRSVLRAGILEPLRALVLYGVPEDENDGIQVCWTYLTTMISYVVDRNMVLHVVHAFIKLPKPLKFGMDEEEYRRWKVVEKDMVVFAKGAWYALEDLCQTEYDVVGLDWLHAPRDAYAVAQILP